MQVCNCGRARGATINIDWETYMISVDSQCSKSFSLPDVEKYRADGYLKVAGLFSAEEIAPLCLALDTNPQMD